MIDNPHLDIVNIGVGLCAPLMGTFDYPLPTDNGHYTSVVPDQPRTEIFQILSFLTTYFNDPWNIPSPSAMMEGKGHHGMAMPLPVIEFAYSIVQQTSVDPDPTFAQDLDPVLETIWAQGSLINTNSLDLIFPSYEVIIEEMTSPDKRWDDLHHRSYFLPKLRRIEGGESTPTMTGDRACHINPLAMHTIYAEGNMETIAKKIPIVISRTPSVMENIFVKAEFFREDIRIYKDLFK
jgi:hypothetical protein